MFILGLVCLFISFFMLIMGLMAWGAMTQENPEAEQPPTEQRSTDHDQTPGA